MKKKFWIVNVINPSAAEILLYGYISEYDISCSDFVIELSQLSNQYNDLKIRINSGGGSVFEGIAIYNAIKSMQKSGKKITTSIDGIAASMAGVIAIAGNPVQISKYGKIMIHRAAGGAYGDADQMRQQAQLVEDAEKDIVQMFAERTGMTPDEVKAKWLQSGVDNWLSADKCIQFHLVDEVYDADPVPVPENITDEKQVHNIFQSVLNKSIPQFKNTNMKSIAKLLGLSEDATESQIETAVSNLIATMKAAQEAVTNTIKANAESLVNDAITAKKITADKKEAFVAMAISNYEGAKTALDLIPAVKKPTDIINRANPELLNNEGAEGTTPPAVTGKAGEGWDKLVSQGIDVVEKVKRETPDVYAKLYKDKYHRDPSQMGYVK